MSKLILSVNVTLDGNADHYVAIADDEMHRYVTGLLENADAVLFGRETFLLFRDYWPRAVSDPSLPEPILEFARKINDIPKIVFSNSMRNPGWKNTQLITGNSAEEINKLKQSGDQTLLIFGSLKLSGDLIGYNLVDDFIILMQPMFSGKGVKLFDKLSKKLNLELLSVKNFRSGVVVLHYQLKT